MDLLHVDKTKRIFYNAEIVNSSNTSILCQYDVQLLKPMIDTGLEDWTLNINRFRLPLYDVPLTVHNIPFQQWEVSLGYYNNNNIWVYENAYVPQYNPRTADVSSYLLTETVLERGKVSNGTFNASNSIDIYSNVICGNSNFLVVGIAGTTSITIYNSQLQQLQVLGLNYFLCSMCMDSNNNIYIGESTGQNFFIGKATYNGNKSWSLNDTSKLYTSLSQVNFSSTGSLAAIISEGDTILYAANPNNGRIYSWNNTGEPTGYLLYNNSFIPSRLCSSGSNLFSSYDPLQQAITYDNLYGLLYNTIIDLSNGQQQATAGDVVSQCVLFNNAVYGLGADGNMYFQSLPLAVSNVWQPAVSSGFIPCEVLTSYSNRIFAIGQDHSFCAWRYHGNNNFTKLYDVFILSSSVAAQAMDLDINRIIYIVGNDLRLYKSSIPLQERIVLTPCQGGYQVIGNYESSTTSIASTTSSLTEDIYCYSYGMTFGSYFFIRTNAGEVLRLNGNLTGDTPLAVPQCNGSITGLSSDSLLNRLYVSSIVSGSNVVNIYDLDGNYLGNIAVGGSSSSLPTVPITGGSSPFLAVCDNSTIYIYNVANPASPSQVLNYVLPGAASSIAFNPNDPASLAATGFGGTIYCTTQGGVIKLEMSDNTYSFVANSIGVFNGNFSSISFYNQELYLSSSSSSTVQIYATDTYTDGENLTLTTSFTVPNYKAGILPVIPVDSLFNGSYNNNFFGISQISSTNFRSVACSKLNTNIYVYNSDNVGSIEVYETTPSLSLLYVMNLSTDTYQIISCLPMQLTPSQETTSRIVALGDSLTPSTITTTPILGLGFLALDSTGNFVYSPTSGNSLYTNQGIVSVPGASNLYGYVYAAPEAVDSGNYSIRSMQEYLYQVNQAFLAAFNAISSLPGYAPTVAPYLYYDPESRLIRLILPDDYLDASKYLVDLNGALYDMLYFPCMLDPNNTGYRAVVVVDTLTNKTGNSLFVLQETTTINKFNDLVRVIIKTNVSSIPIAGDNEGTNSNEPIITDVCPDTSTLSPLNILIYQPTILRKYNIYGTTQINKIFISFWYGTRQGHTYPVYLSAGHYASCKLEFEKIQEK